ncbi:hypothetical protein PpBr36_00006 [Pyricularia pennisetigena]|uniref:hypothetical protein n=1 Tax=Pyricularia pennisetigena TaxID=1578925 RepID=UPI001153ECAD|nr:hypothetical protein PpBr36_00006 [Pyricularia pennisetigena]TLS29310.1 hypothetical protein PpBr36_00006 [Pyricularia pennisetigena]
MSTDVVLVARSVEPEFYSVLCKAAARHAQEATRLITDKSDERVQGLLQDAEDKGATLFRFSSAGETAVGSSGERPSGTIIRNLTRSMAFWKTEAFGPVLGIFAFDDASEVPGLVAESNYGLSAAIFTRDHMKALHLARALPSGAVHVNAPTAHDEAVLPHGGYRDSGWGRFGSHWGFEEFLQTKTVILNP